MQREVPVVTVTRAARARAPGAAVPVEVTVDRPRRAADHRRRREGARQPARPLGGRGGPRRAELGDGRYRWTLPAGATEAGRTRDHRDRRHAGLRRAGLRVRRPAGAGRRRRRRAARVRGERRPVDRAGDALRARAAPRAAHRRAGRRDRRRLPAVARAARARRAARRAPDRPRRRLPVGRARRERRRPTSCASPSASPTAVARCAASRCCAGAGASSRGRRCSAATAAAWCARSSSSGRCSAGAPGARSASPTGSARAHGWRVTLTRRGRVVRRLRSVTRAAGRTYRLRVSARGLRRGDYAVRLSVTRAGGAPKRAALIARRL